MLKKILVALDRSSEAATVLDSAFSLAEPRTTEMLLVHFVDWTMQDVSPWIGIATLYDVDLLGERYDWTQKRLKQEVDIVNDWLKTLVEKAHKLGIDCKYECHIGNCNLGIGDRAKDWGADVVVMGRRGRKNISEMFLGSVSNYVIHHAPCSVLVVQGAIRVKAEVLPNGSYVND
ncbi:MAG: universal stress protein [Cyanobacteria bacterium J06631_6]